MFLSCIVGDLDHWSIQETHATPRDCAYGIFAVAYFQPTAQTYPTQNGGAAFPDVAGQAISIPNAANNVSHMRLPSIKRSDILLVSC